MTDLGGITELQLLEQHVQLLKKKADAVKTADKTSAGCSRIASSIQASQGKDWFVVSEGGSANNVFHTAAGTTGESGCCVIS
jgi:hypothetical protein